MPGGLIQLVSYGSANIWLTGNPQITFFKTVFKRHTHFAMESIKLDFVTKPSFSVEHTTTATVNLLRNADLLHDLYLVYDTPNIVSNEELGFKWVPFIGQNIINYAELLIGGQRIDRLYSQWMNIWNELTLPRSKKEAYYSLIGNVPEMHPNYYATAELHLAIPSRRLYLPLDFWFCRNNGLALPLIALQYTEVTLNIEFRRLNDLFTIGNPPLAPDYFFGENNCEGANAALKRRLIDLGYGPANIFKSFTRNWTETTYVEANYIYLDTIERKKFALASHEYLITVTQPLFFSGLKQDFHALDLKLQHPTKELIWAFQRPSVRFSNQWNNYTAVNDIEDYQRVLSQSEDKYHNLGFNQDLLDDAQTREFISEVKNINSTTTILDACKIEPFQEYHNILSVAGVRFNGHDRFEPKDHFYFSNLQPYKHHTGFPSVKGIYVYSFALRPEEDQPSGNANLSRVKRIELTARLNRIQDPLEPLESYNLALYAQSQNVLRIMGGIGALVFAN